MTLRLARALGMGEQGLAQIRRGALLHDIGKMGIPDAILLKPGPLTDRERQVMERHPVMPMNCFTQYTTSGRRWTSLYCHHEKWDGTGYPRGSKGEEIPLAARLFAVVDVWDALRSDRPYRPACSEEEALAYLREQAGKHFDPDAVKVFLQMITSGETD